MMSSEVEINSGETDALRSEALTIVRAWITKHPRIVNCRTDDEFLLRFLRAKDFSIPGACARIENYLTIRKTLSHLFSNLDMESSEFKTIFGFKSIAVLQERNKKGRLVYYIDIGKIDLDKCSVVDLIRITNLVFESLAIDDRSQINGIIIVVNYTNAKLTFAAMWTPRRIKELIQCLVKGVPLYLQKIFFVNVPCFPRIMIQLITPFLNYNLKRRITVTSKV